MNPYFADQEAWNNYDKILRSWIGTPFRHLWGAKGRGADCTLFLGNALLEHGVLDALEHDYYSRDWHIHTTEEKVMNGFYHHIASNMGKGYGIYLMPIDTVFMRGDILGFSTTTTGVTNHCGIIMDEPKLHMINSINRRGVCIIPVVSWWLKHLKNVFRVVKE